MIQIIANPTEKNGPQQFLRVNPAHIVYIDAVDEENDTRPTKMYVKLVTGERFEITDPTSTDKLKQID